MQCLALGNFYSNDLHGKELFDETIDVLFLLSSQNVNIARPLYLLFFIVEYGGDVFPNLKICLQLFYTVRQALHHANDHLVNSNLSARIFVPL